VDEHGDHTEPDPPSWEQIEYNSLVVIGAPHDPEDTLNFALTRQELALITFAVQVLVRFIPELGFITMAFLQKITELGGAQGFLEVTPEVREAVGLEPLEEEDEEDE
jgi:hypothetical protein